jgi:[NiFe] hydrogenase diaphorase moiety small subunit
MSDTFTFTIDGHEVQATKGQKIIEAADAAGIYIPRLCWLKGLTPSGSCRVCTVLVNGRPAAACTQPATPGAVVQNDTAELKEWRKSLIEMLFVEGNHFCPVCEKSGNCRLQAMGYRLGMAAPRYPYQSPKRDIDASHPDVLIDRDRCILCGLCVRASRELDHKNVWGLVGRGFKTRVAPNADQVAGTDLSAADKAAELCPVGAILKKRIGYAVPIGKREYDQKPIGSNIEETRK